MKTRTRFKKILPLLFCLFISHAITPNNISIANITTIVSGSITQVQFDLSWDNSWRTSTGISNYDAAWIFIKYYDPVQAKWTHLNLTGSNNSAPSGYAITVPADNVGAFVYRSADGSGTNTLNGVQLGVTQVNGLFDIRVFGIEMVYVPQASFQLGDGTSSNFLRNGSTTSSYTVTGNASSVTMGTSTGQLNDVAGINGTLASNYPTGYSSFYCMKYELSQGAYRDFLNTLTYTQQANRTANAPNSVAGTGALVAAGTNRNFIEIKTPGVSATSPAVYGCDANANNVWDETSDGEWIACNYGSWPNLCAYLDWAGLRPMTEMEYEKACRGTSTPVAGEYAWGNANIHASSYTISSAGQTGEVFSNASTTNGNANIGSLYSSGPVRSGIFATISSNRVTSGSSIYGIMEMTGNLYEGTVTLNNLAGLSYTGLNGNGTLNTNGEADVDYWPGINGNGTATTPNAVYGGTTGVTNSAGTFSRGGLYSTSASTGCVSYRAGSSGIAITPFFALGIRGVR